MADTIPALDAMSNVIRTPADTTQTITIDTIKTVDFIRGIGAMAMLIQTPVDMNTIRATIRTADASKTTGTMDNIIKIRNLHGDSALKRTVVAVWMLLTSHCCATTTKANGIFYVMIAVPTTVTIIIRMKRKTVFVPPKIRIRKINIHRPRHRRKAVSTNTSAMMEKLIASIGWPMKTVTEQRWVNIAYGWNTLRE